jgi:hypothetical protein
VAPPIAFERTVLSKEILYGKPTGQLFYAYTQPLIDGLLIRHFCALFTFGCDFAYLRCVVFVFGHFDDSASELCASYGM